MQNILKQNDQISFDDFLGEDFRFFNKDMDTDGSHKKREKTLIHSDECDWFDCFKQELLG